MIIKEVKAVETSFCHTLTEIGHLCLGKMNRPELRFQLLPFLEH